jgi:hypothetical protein
MPAHLVPSHASGKSSVAILLVTQSIGYDVGLSEVVIDSDVIILNQLYPSALPQIQINLGKQVIEALVVMVYLT